MFTSSTKREISEVFSHRSRAVTAKKCRKNDAHAKLLLCHLGLELKSSAEVVL